MSSDYLRPEEVRWFAPVLADVERAIARGMTPSDAFMEVAGGLPAGDYTRLQLHWLEGRKVTNSAA